MAKEGCAKQVAQQHPELRESLCITSILSKCVNHARIEMTGIETA